MHYILAALGLIKARNQRGFTLIELSIVLVIIGLIVGGVLVGRDLIRASELRSVITEYQRYVTAVATFRGKYEALPGDMSNATTFWGAQNADPATCATTASTTQLTCNGDGNGRADGIGGGDVHEVFRFWQHLANAGLIEGKYNGLITDTACWLNMNTRNSPQSKVDNNALWGLREPFTQLGSTELFDATYSHMFQLGWAGTCDNFGAILRPRDLYSIDSKMDDGKPGTGKVMIRANAGLATCSTATSSSDYSATYLMSATSKSCAAIFPSAF